jgi:small subunit ribosomal protein S29
MIRRSIRNLCSEVLQPKATEKVRVISFDLPVTLDSTRLTERERSRNKITSTSAKQDKINSQMGKLDEFFPTSVISPQPDELSAVDPVKVPHLWLNSDEIPSISDVGRYMRFARNELLEILPEGLAGELPRDVFLMPSRTRDIGIMYRKTTHEILSQLRLLEGRKSIPKAGWLLEGKRGAGKSAILNTIVAWARRRGNWIVLFEPLGSRFGKEIASISRSSCGIYIQSELAKQLLERFLSFNTALLEEIPVNLELYGRAGIDSSQLETVERVYLPLIEKAVADRPGLSLDERIREIARLRHSLVLPSVRSQLKEPHSVAELCEFGISNSSYATQVVAEILTQLKAQDKYPVLVAVDEFNELFVVSEYVSTRYDNTIFNGYIPSYHLSIPRLLCRWDGMEFKRGLKIYSTSWAKRNRRQFDPTILGIKPEEIKQVRNFTKLEFAHYLAYQQITGTSHRFPKSKLDYFFMLTQGNGFQARRALATLH